MLTCELTGITEATVSAGTNPTSVPDQPQPTSGQTEAPPARATAFTTPPARTEGVLSRCRKAAESLEHAHDRGRPLLPPPEPLLLSVAPGRRTDPARATAALHFTERFPVGCCELDLDGKVTFVNPAGVVGVAPRDLMGQPGPRSARPACPDFEDEPACRAGPREPARVTSPGRVVENAYTKPTDGASRPATAPPASGATTGIHA
ncbi:hypothetical protein CFP59_09370 [Streptomyces malaysiensis subsp. malaysiensis]|nr:hypothetical protein CFP59_09370 [Streptomyces sp. M56]